MRGRDYLLSAWPEEAYPYEPAHGFFRRLAKVNHQLSAATFAASLELNGRNIDLAEMLSFCGGLPTAHIERLADATPINRGKLVELNGQTFSKQRDFTVRSPRVCAGCIAEKAYYRNWFDLTVLSCCPLHKMGLNPGGPDRMAWWHPEIAPAFYLETSEPTKNDVMWSAYVLGRMGVLRRGVAVALDSEPLHEIIPAALQIGRAAVSGWASVAPRNEANPARLVSLGFEVLRHGNDRIEDFFRDIGRQGGALAATGDLQFGMTRRFGWIAEAVGRLPATATGDLVRHSLNAAANRSGVYSRKQQGVRSALSRTHLTLHELARQTGLKPHKAREIAIKLGLTTPRPKTECHSFSEASASTFKATFEGAVSRTQAADLLGVSSVDFDAIYKEGLVERLVRLEVPDKSGDRFLPETLASFMASFKDHACQVQGEKVSLARLCEQLGRNPGEIIIAVCRGKQQLAGWDEEKVGLQGAVFVQQEHQADTPEQFKRQRSPGGKRRTLPDRPGLAFSDAAALLGAHPNSIRGLVDDGHLMLLKRKGGATPRLDERSVRRFARTYAPGRLYADVLKLSSQKIFADATRARVRKPPGATQYGYLWLHRKDAERKLGWVLEDSNDPRTGRLWSALRAHLSDARSTNRLVTGGQGRARIRAGTSNVLFDIEARAQGLDVVVSANAEKEPARYAKFVKDIDLLVAGMPTASFSFDSGQIALRQSFRPEGADTEAWMIDIARIIDELGAMVHRVVRT